MKKYILLFFVLFPVCSVFGQSISTDKNAVIHSKLRVATTNEADGNDPTKAVITINYSDGLGRHLQTVGYQQSPTQKDIITGATTYDKYGRATVSVLPVPATSGTGAYQSNVIGLGQSFYGDTRPYSSVSAFDNSPLNRERETIGAGQAWASNNKKSQIFNESAGSEVRIYKLDGSNNIILSGTYPTNSLYKKRLIDEQGHTSIEITDKRGRLVQKQQQDASGYITTYFINDGLGRVLATIQPEGYELNASINYNSTEWQRWVFFYLYDYRGRLVEKKTPGAETEYMVYDKWDRMVWHQTAQQREKGLWTFKKYDGLNRLVMSGEKSENRNRVDLQAEASAWNGGRYESRMVGGVSYSLTNSYPTLGGTSEIREVFYYDDYGSWLSGDMAFDRANAYHDQHPESHNMATGGMVRNTENNDRMTYVNYYDNKRRIIQTFAHNVYGQIERTDFQYNFAGDILEIKSLLRDENNVANVQVERFEYDNVGNRTVFKVAMGAAPTETVCSYEYNEILQQKTKKYYPNRQYGQIPTTPDFIIRPPSPTAQNTQDIAKRYILLQPNTVINSTDLNSYLAQIGQGAVSNVVVQGLQTMNFGYHLRGMMNCVNCASGLPVLDDMQNDIFANKLNFEENGLYDGNIAKQLWRSKKDNILRSYLYGYDPAKRSTSATYSAENSNENFNLTVNGYDKNGNIIGLNRNGLNGSSYGAIDQLSYFYNGNRLNGVTDGINGNASIGDFKDNGSNSDYSYWTDGSLKSDANKGISSIDYDTYLQKIKQINFSNGKFIKLFYGLESKVVKRLNSDNERWEYTPKSIYKNGALHQISQAEGRILKLSNQFVFEFEYRDIWRNLRASFRDSLATPSNGIYAPPVITQTTDYDLYGFELSNSQKGSNNFLYQNQERVADYGLSWDFFSRRPSDNQLGRFTSIDPIASDFPHNSPYALQENKFGLGVELEGMELLQFSAFKMLQAYDNKIRSYQNNNNILERSVIRTNPIDALIVQGSRVETDKVVSNINANKGSEERLNPQSDNLGNAIKHTFWQATVTSVIGREEAKKFGDAHEKGDIEGSTETARQMDLANNEVGYDIGTKFSINSSGSAILSAILQAGLQGKLSIIENGKVVKTAITKSEGQVIQKVINQMRESETKREESAKTMMQQH